MTDVLNDVDDPTEEQEEVLAEEDESSDEVSFVFPDWVKECDYTLVNTEEAFNKLIAELSLAKVYAVDIETTGVNLLSDKIAGISFSTKPKTGYYVPLKHIEGVNLPDSYVKQLEKHLSDKTKVKLFYNSKFDKGFFLEEYNIVVLNTFDVMADAYVYNPNRFAKHKASLKDNIEFYFNVKPIRLREILGIKGRGKDDINFATVNPDKGVIYACQDADFTLRLWLLLEDLITTEGRKYKHLSRRSRVANLENKTGDIVQKIERQGVLVNKERVDYLHASLLNRQTRLSAKLLEIFGEINFNSPVQLREALYGENGLKLKPLKKTKTGADSTDEATLDGLYKSEKNERKRTALKTLLDYRTVTKALGTYIDNMKRVCETSPGSVAYFTFKSMQTDTGRFAASGGNGHFSGINVQSFPKHGDAKVIFAKKLKVYDKNNLPIKRVDPNNLFVSLETVKKINPAIDTTKPIIHYYGNDYCLLKSCKDCEVSRWCTYDYEMIDITELEEDVLNYRACFSSRPGFVIGKFDYSNEELRIAANLSGEELWTKAFNDGKDLHFEMAKIIFNLPDTAKPEDYKKERGIAKTINFAILYGASAKKIAANAGIPVEDAKRIIEEYYKRVPKVLAWIKEQHRKVKELEGVETFFGRFRPIPEANALQEKERAKAERLSQNTPVQGAAADIMKITLVKLAREISRNGYQDDIKILLTVHDELVFELRETKLETLVPFIQKVMTLDLQTLADMDLPHWKVPILVDGDVGTSWGLAMSWEKYHKETEGIKKVEEELKVLKDGGSAPLSEDLPKVVVTPNPKDLLLEDANKPAVPIETQTTEHYLYEGRELIQYTEHQFSQISGDSIVVDFNKLGVSETDDVKLQVIEHALNDPLAKGDRKVYLKYLEAGVTYLYLLDYKVKNEQTVRLALNRAKNLL